MAKPKREKWNRMMFIFLSSYTKETFAARIQEHYVVRKEIQ